MPSEPSKTSGPPSHPIAHQVPLHCCDASASKKASPASPTTSTYGNCLLRHMQWVLLLQSLPNAPTSDPTGLQLPSSLQVRLYRTLARRHRGTATGLAVSTSTASSCLHLASLRHPCPAVSRLQSASLALPCDQREGIGYCSSKSKQLPPPRLAGLNCVFRALLSVDSTVHPLHCLGTSAKA